MKAECYDEAMTGEFSQFEEKTVLLVHDQLMVEKPYEGEVQDCSYSSGLDEEKSFFTNTAVIAEYIYRQFSNQLHGTLIDFGCGEGFFAN